MKQAYIEKVTDIGFRENSRKQVEKAGRGQETDKKMLLKWRISTVRCSTLHHTPPTDFNKSEDVGNEPRTVATLALAVRRSNPIELDLIHNWNLRPNKLRLTEANISQMKDERGSPGKKDTLFRSAALTL